MFNPVTKEWEAQQVSFGQLSDGTPGLFTNGILAWHLKKDENPKAVAEKFGWKFIEKG